MSGVFTATIFIPDIIIPANLFPGVFTAAGITEWSYYLVQSGKKRIRNTRSYTFFVVTFHNQSLNLLSYFTLFYVAVSSSPVWYLVVVLDLAAAAVLLAIAY